MPEIVKLGPFIVKSSWLVILAGMFLGFQLMKRRLQREQIQPATILDLLSNSLVILALSWKLLPILFNPSLLWNSPWTVLFLPGSEKDLWLGGLIVILYLGWKLKKVNISYLLLLDILPFGILLPLVLYDLLILQYGSTTTWPWGLSIQDEAYTYHPIGVYQAMLLIPLAMGLWIKKESLGKGKYGSIFLIGFGFVEWLLSFFKDQSIGMGGLSTAQLWAMVVVGLGILLNPIDSPIQTDGKESGKR